MHRRSFIHAGLGAGIATAVGRFAGLAACSQAADHSSGTRSTDAMPLVWPNATWGDVPIGGGGYITANAVDLNSGIMWCGTDVQNCYLRRPGDAKWATVFRRDTLPASDLVRNAGTDGLGSNMGTFAGTDGTRAYSQINNWAYTLDFDADVPLTATGGIKATRWNLPTKSMKTNNGWSRWWGPGMSGHPTNKNICLLGTCNDGAYYTLDGGKSVVPITVPACVKGADGVARYLVWQGETHSFVFVQGVGLHRSLTGADGQFVLIPGGPLRASSLYGEADGNLWLTGEARTPNATNNGYIYTMTSPDAGIWRLDDGAAQVAFVANPLKQWTSYGPWHVAVDPHNPNNLVCWMEQLGAVSTDRGKTWALSSQAKIVAGGEAAWRLGNMFAGGGPAFTRTPGELLWGEGFGCVLTEDYASQIETNIGGAKYWQVEGKDYSKGIEEFIVNNIFTHPTTGRAWFNCWDRQIVEIVSLTDYINTPKLAVGTGLSAALGFDCAIDEPDYYVCGAGSGTPSHSWSKGGDTFNLFDPSPKRDQVFPPRPSDTTGLRGGSAGPVAVGNRNDIVIVQSNNWPAIETKGRFNPATGIPDRAEDWSVIELGGSTNYATLSAFYVTRKSVSADKNRPGVMAMAVSNMDPLVRNATNNPLGGLWIRSGADKPWEQTVKGIIGGKGELSQFWACQLAYVPGHSGELLYTGYINQTHCPLVHLKDDGRTDAGLNPDVTDVLAFGFGKNEPGAPYPAVLFRGKYKGVEAFWLTLDWFKSVQFVSDLFPNNYWSAGTSSIAGDLSKDGHGKWLISVGGKGAIFARLDGSFQEELTKTRPLSVSVQARLSPARERDLILRALS